MTQYITTSYTLDLILGQKSWIIQTTQKMWISCLLELYFPCYSLSALKQLLQSKCTLAQGNSGSVLPVLLLRELPASCIPSLASSHALAQGRKRDYSCSRWITASLLSPASLQVTVVKEPSSPHISRGEEDAAVSL